MGARPSTPANTEPNDQPTCSELPQDEIRSSVPFMGHVVPGTIKLQPSTRAAGHLRLTFRVNAPVACRVSVFLQATEDLLTGSIGIAPTVSMVYSPGLQQPFARTLVNNSEHLRCQDGQYIIIRVESFIASHATFMPSALPAPGAPLEHHTNAHTVFCCPRPQRGGLCSIRVLSERLWLAGTPYTLPDGLPTLPAIGDAYSPHHSNLLWHQEALLEQQQPPLQQPPPLWQQQMWPQEAYPWQQQQPQWQQQPPLWQAPMVLPGRPVAPTHCMLCPPHARRRVAVQNTLCQHMCMCEPCGMEQAQSSEPSCPLCGLPLESLLRVNAPFA